jgi:hypothetical protein
MNKDNKLIKIFIGYDPVESIAWHTLAHSIYTLSSKPVAIIPLNVRNLKGLYARERDPKQSNEFSFTRFLVPYLADFDGFAVFLDCDMLLRDDISNIFDVINQLPNKAVYVVKHDYEPKNKTKYLNNIQYSYPRKNWSSVILWNCSHPKNKILIPEYINSASAMELHRFLWLADNEIGDLDIKWNWLVGEYQNPPQDVKNVHWTIGGPYFKEYRNADFSEEWFKEKEKMTYCKQRDQ